MERNGEFVDRSGRASPQRIDTLSDHRSHSTEIIAEGIEQINLKLDNLTMKLGAIERIIVEAFADSSRKKELISLSQQPAVLKLDPKDASSLSFVKSINDPCPSPTWNAESKNSEALAYVTKQEAEMEAKRKEEKERRAAEMREKLEEERRQAEAERQRKLALDAKRRSLINTLVTPKSGDTLFGDEKKESASIFD